MRCAFERSATDVDRVHIYIYICKVYIQAWSQYTGTNLDDQHRGKEEVVLHEICVMRRVLCCKCILYAQLRKQKNCLISFIKVLLPFQYFDENIKKILTTTMISLHFADMVLLRNKMFVNCLVNFLLNYSLILFFQLMSPINSMIFSSPPLAKVRDAICWTT